MHTLFKPFLKSYLIFCTVTSLIICAFFLAVPFQTETILNLQKNLTYYLSIFYSVCFLYGIISLIIFRIFTPSFIYEYPLFKLVPDTFVAIVLYLSYIPNTILIFSYISTEWHIIALYGSILPILLQIPNFLAGIIIGITNSSFNLGLILFLFAFSRFFILGLMFFSFPSDPNSLHHNSHLESDEKEPMPLKGI